MQEIYITENGCATNDVIAADGNIYDTDRIMFLRAFLTQLQRATAEGVPVSLIARAYDTQCIAHVKSCSADPGGALVRASVMVMK